MLSRISHGVRSTVNSVSVSVSNPTRTVLSSCSCSRLSFTPSSSTATSSSHRTFSTDDRPPSSSPSSTSTSTSASTPSSSAPSSASASPFGSPTFRLPTPSTSRPISQKTLHGSYLLDPQNPPLLNANHYKMLQQVDINESDIPPQILAEFRRQISSADETLSSIAAQHKAKYGDLVDNMEEVMGKHWNPDVDQSYLRQPNSEIYDEAIEDPNIPQDKNPIDPKTGLGPFGAPLGSREYRNSPADRDFILDYADLHYKQTGPLITVKRGTCIFCPPHRVGISYTNVELLHRFINERGMITNRKTNYNCAKHQRKIAWTIKRARHLGLLPYTNNWKVPVSFIWGEEQQAIDDFQSAPLASDVDLHADAKNEAESLFASVPKVDPAATKGTATAAAVKKVVVAEDVEMDMDMDEDDDVLTPEQEKEMDQAEKETIENNKQK